MKKHEKWRSKIKSASKNPIQICRDEIFMHVQDRSRQKMLCPFCGFCLKIVKNANSFIIISTWFIRTLDTCRLDQKFQWTSQCEIFTRTESWFSADFHQRLAVKFHFEDRFSLAIICIKVCLSYANETSSSCFIRVTDPVGSPRKCFTDQNFAGCFPSVTEL